MTLDVDMLIVSHMCEDHLDLFLLPVFLISIPVVPNLSPQVPNRLFLGLPSPCTGALINANGLVLMKAILSKENFQNVACW